LYEAICFGLKPKGISREVKGESTTFFFFWRRRSKTFRSSSEPSRVTVTVMIYLNGFRNLTFPENSFPSEPIIVVVAKSLGAYPSPEIRKVHFPMSEEENTISEDSRVSIWLGVYTIFTFALEFARINNDSGYTS